MIVNQIFKSLLRLYPRAHRVAFNAEMLAVFESALAQQRTRGRAAWVRFVICEFAGLLAGACSAWTARFTRPSGPVAAMAGMAGANVPESGLPDELVHAQQRVDALVSGMVHAIAHHQFEKARRYSNQERDEREKLRQIRRRHGLGE